MSEEFITPVQEQKRSNSTILIIILAVLIFLFCCCCLILLAVGWFLGDIVVDWFRYLSLGSMVPFV